MHSTHKLLGSSISSTVRAQLATRLIYRQPRSRGFQVKRSQTNWPRFHWPRTTLPWASVKELWRWKLSKVRKSAWGIFKRLNQVRNDSRLSENSAKKVVLRKRAHGKERARLWRRYLPPVSRAPRPCKPSLINNSLASSWRLFSRLYLLNVAERRNGGSQSPEHLHSKQVNLYWTKVQQSFKSSRRQCCKTTSRSHPLGRRARWLTLSWRT